MIVTASPSIVAACNLWRLGMQLDKDEEVLNSGMSLCSMPRRESGVW
jgi:hypothetical protein